MALRVTTTSTDILINDLGLFLEHPTTNRDLALEFSAEELKESEDLTSAIQSGDLFVDDGQFEIAGTDYNPNEVVNQELLLNIDSRFISREELAAGHLNTYIKSGVFPLSLNSTSSITRNIYTPSAKWGTWQADIDNKVVISGSTAADGTYTIESVIDNQNFIVKESIADSTGGAISVYHENAASIIGVDSTNFENITGSNLQETIDSIDYNIGLQITEEEHRNLDQLVHNIAEDTYEEFIYGQSNRVTNIIMYTDSTKTTKIREEQMSYTGNKIAILTTIQYDSNGDEVERIVETYNYTNNKITSVEKEYISA